jgi:hypothetical protein
MKVGNWLNRGLGDFSRKACGSNLEMLDEYALVPDIFEPSSYSNAAFIEMCLPHLKEPILQEALVRDLCSGGWSKFCLQNAGNMHRLCKEILKKLSRGNRLRAFPHKRTDIPDNAADWCQEALDSFSIEPLTGIIVAHATKENFPAPEVACIEKITAILWWQARSPSITVDRKTDEYLKVLKRVLLQANFLMFIDPNLDPSQHNYRDFYKLLAPAVQRVVKPKIEIHRSLCDGDGPNRTFPTELEWKKRFIPLATVLASFEIKAEIFIWDDFHERYLIADIVGASVGGGFDITGKSNDWSTWGRLGRDDKDKIQRLFDPAVRSDKLRWRFAIS